MIIKKIQRKEQLYDVCLLRIFFKIFCKRLLKMKNKSNVKPRRCNDGLYYKLWIFLYF
jgi:hypothetical protein